MGLSASLPEGSMREGENELWVLGNWVWGNGINVKIFFGFCERPIAGLRFRHNEG
jgi:hypothetical protein